jgi:transcriptional regulator with XRE-family HTH domain
MTVGDAARLIRERAGLTMRAAGELLGVTHVCLSLVERGKNFPSVDLLSRYRQHLEFDPYLLAALANDPAAVRDHEALITQTETCP